MKDYNTEWSAFRRCSSLPMITELNLENLGQEILHFIWSFTVKKWQLNCFMQKVSQEILVSDRIKEELRDL